MARWWQAAWWREARDRRLVAMGGHSQVGELDRPEIEPFAPAAVNDEAARRKIDELVSGLAPGAVDEATGHSLDNMINAWADQWVTDVCAQHAWYVARASLRQDLSDAAARQVNDLAAHDRTVLAHTVLAVESALLRLVGLGSDSTKGRGLLRRLAFWRRGSARPPEMGDQEPVGMTGRSSWSWDNQSGATGRDGHHRMAPEKPGGGASAVDLGSRPEQHPEPPRPYPEAQQHPGAGAEDGPEESPVPDTADLTILLGPANRRSFARWSDRGYADATLMGGRSRVVYLHVVALALAAAADIGAFSQIVDQLMSTEPGWLVAIVVVGFTATVLYLAHACGTMLRDRRAGARWIPWIAPGLCALIWLGLGAAAFYLRLRFAPQPTQLPSFSFSGPAPSTGPNVKPYNAALFLALYVATGMVAGVGAYLSHNPLRESYATARRGYRKATERVAATSFQAGKESARHLAAQRELEAAALTLETEKKKRLALAAELKQLARVRMAQRMQDPAATDAIFGEDWRPYGDGPAID